MLGYSSGIVSGIAGLSSDCNTCSREPDSGTVLRAVYAQDWDFSLGNDGLRSDPRAVLVAAQVQEVGDLNRIYHCRIQSTDIPAAEEVSQTPVPLPG